MSEFPLLKALRGCFKNSNYIKLQETKENSPFINFIYPNS